jgi:hypothetical protein
VYTECPKRKGQYSGKSKQKKCPFRNGFRNRVILLYSARIFDKIYYVLFLIPVFIVEVTKLVQFTYVFENSTVDINALCNSREDMACCSSEFILTLAAP